MSRKVIVLKFGSSVLHSRAELPRAVHEIYRWIRRQYRVVAVVSAFAGETDRLLGTVADYRDACPEAIARVVATGEEVATAFLALELDRFGIPAQVLDPSQIQLIAETTSNDTEPVSADILAIENVFKLGRVAVIPGFVARDRLGRVALFGRGGSDLSALFLAKQLGARCRLIKDVDGIYDSDPAACSDAKRFDEINFSDALAIGGKIVQQKAIAFGRKTGVSVRSRRPRRELRNRRRQPSLGSLGARRSSQAPLKIGLLGLGTVGLGVFQELAKHPELFEVTGIAVRRPDLHSDHAPSNLLTRDCWNAIDDVDVVVELIGGTDPAGELVKAALAAGKPVVTANKLLLAHDAQLDGHHSLRYSAAVGGAVPALEAVRALARRRPHRLALRRSQRNLQLHPRSPRRRMFLVAGRRRSAGPRLRRAGSPRRRLRLRHGLQASPARSPRLSRRRCTLRQRYRHRGHRSRLGAVSGTRRRPRATGRHRADHRRPGSSRSETHAGRLVPSLRANPQRRKLPAHRHRRLRVAAGLDRPRRWPLAHDCGRHGRLV